MGLSPFWQEDFLMTMQALYHPANIHQAEPYFVVNFNDKVFVHLVPIDNRFEPQELIALQSEFQSKEQLLVQLWEDVWLHRRDQVISRIRSFLSLNKTVHGRKAKIIPLSETETFTFLEREHLQGAVNAKFNFGLRLNEELLAVASFSRPRPLKDKPRSYLSAELVRFASKTGITVTGGLSKLIKHFSQQTGISDLMTYADRDWSVGLGYEKIGFVMSNTTPPAVLYVEMSTGKRYFPHRLPEFILSEFEKQKVLDLDSFLMKMNFIKVFNTGNLKYHLYF